MDAGQNLVNHALSCSHRGDGGRQRRREVTDLQRQIERLVYTQVANRRCRLDKEMKEKGATQISQD